MERKTSAIVLDYGDGNLNAALTIDRFRRRNMVHAYLLSGAKGLGKKTLALVLACTLFCEADRKPCFSCNSCRQVLDGNNPDILTLFAEDGKQIKIDDVRDILSAVSQHSFGTGFRVVILGPVERMTPQAQNCLLKSLEEPLSDVVFLLVTNELSATLGTIASRCSRVKLLPRRDEVLTETLQKSGFEAGKIAEILPRCGGNIGQAVELLLRTGEESAGERFAQEALLVCSDSAAAALSTRMKESKDQSEALLRALEDAVHRAMMVASGCMAPQAINDLPVLWQRAAEKHMLGEMNRVLTEIFETRRRGASQVNWYANLDHLMMTILEENRQWQQLLG